MSFLVAISLTLVLAAAIAVVMTEDPHRQAVTLSLFGVCLAVLFFVLQAPDVALSQVAVGTAIVPLMVLLTISKIRGSR
ncbi:MAG TPA: hydrogenase subunit MbhD domain-containing protein [Mycobacteriales bacterium]|nr:hydrogenase subunit MbhD domain-containing protein [Mycobacteriales bacterium]